MSPQQVETIVRYTTELGRALGVRGLFNIQYVVFEGAVYVIEVNPRGSRTVPFLSQSDRRADGRPGGAGRPRAAPG